MLILNKERYKSSTKSSRNRRLRKFVRELDSLNQLTFNSLTPYKKYISNCLQYNAFDNAKKLLLALDIKFPDEVWIKSRLGRTLGNLYFKEFEQARSYLTSAITLHTKTGNMIEARKHIFYLLYNCLNENNIGAFDKHHAIYKSTILSETGYPRLLLKVTIVKQNTPTEIATAYNKAKTICNNEKELSFIEKLYEAYLNSI